MGLSWIDVFGNHIVESVDDNWFWVLPTVLTLIVMIAALLAREKN